ncbi:SLAM family member 7-like isoform X2 [Salmo trutta]|uniref:SLAM family member 7-like isoform X2 n=1 Tax=Salmo trutta TaxID=8032 RepID=UPI00113210BE|nr:SLAM family member 7-like isoform X2 [Salmo trutta]
MATLHFPIAILLTLLHQAVSSSGTPVFVEKGQDVRLDVQGYMTVKNNLKRLNRFQWRFNTSDNVVTYTHEIETQVTPKYQGRAEFIDGNFSLLLKNLKEGDSGCYTAAVRAEKNQDVAKYQISVQERVEPPVLTVDSVSYINATCNMTVTCRGQKTSVVTSSCNNSTCSHVGGESRGAETSPVPLLSVYVAGGSIICNHSNQVSWASDTKEIETICLSKSGPEWEDHYTVIVMILVIIITILVGLGAAALICWLKRSKRGKEDIINTDYATVGIQAGGEEQTSPGRTTPTIYSMVGLPQPQPVNHQPLPEDLPMTSMPESLYAMVGKTTSKQ